MASVGLILGSNLDGKFQYLKSAKELLKCNVGHVLKASSVYVSPPWGYNSSNEYVNQLLLIETDLTPLDLLDKNLLIEKVLGRERFENGYADRTIDIDILFYENQICDTERLVLPHPRLHLRKFCLEPLAEVLSDWEHPKFRVSITQLRKECEDKSDLRKIETI